MSLKTPWKLISEKRSARSDIRALGNDETDETRQLLSELHKTIAASNKQIRKWLLAAGIIIVGGLVLLNNEPDSGENPFVESADTDGIKLPNKLVRVSAAPSSKDIEVLKGRLQKVEGISEADVATTIYAVTNNFEPNISLVNAYIEMAGEVRKRANTLSVSSGTPNLVSKLGAFFVENGKPSLCYTTALQEGDEPGYTRVQKTRSIGGFMTVDQLDESSLHADVDASPVHQWFKSHNMPYWNSSVNTLFLPNVTAQNFEVQNEIGDALLLALHDARKEKYSVKNEEKNRNAVLFLEYLDPLYAPMSDKLVKKFKPTENIQDLVFFLHRLAKQSIAKYDPYAVHTQESIERTIYIVAYFVSQKLSGEIGDDPNKAQLFEQVSQLVVHPDLIVIDRK